MRHCYEYNKKEDGGGGRSGDFEYFSKSHVHSDMTHHVVKRRFTFVIVPLGAAENEEKKLRLKVKEEEGENNLKFLPAQKVRPELCRGRVKY